MVASFFPLSKSSKQSELWLREKRQQGGQWPRTNYRIFFFFLICSLAFILERPLLCRAWCLVDKGRTHGQEIMLSSLGLLRDSRQRRPSVFPFESAAQSCLLFSSPGDSGFDCLT